MAQLNRSISAFGFLAALLAALCFTGPLSAEGEAQVDRGVIALDSPSVKPAELYEESHALLIGASNYNAGMPKLPGVKEDIRAVNEVLVRRGFKVEIVEDPDIDQLERAYRDFINRYGLNPKNRLIFYFAGHGVTLRQSYGDEMGYILPVDAPPPSHDEAGFLRHAMDMQQIEVYARRIQARHALFLFDSCFSGSLFAMRGAGSVPTNISYKTVQPVRQFITSGGSEESVPDVSVFRQQLVMGLDGEADVNHDGYVTGSELGEFLQQRVVDYTRGMQHPQYGKIRDPSLDRGDFVFILPGADRPIDAGSLNPGQAAQVESRGFLYLNSRPEAAIRIDKEAVSGFPILNLPLQPGRHTVEFVLPQGQRVEQEIDLPSGRTLRCVAHFDQNEVLCKQDDLEHGSAGGANTGQSSARASEALSPGLVVLLSGASEWQALHALRERPHAEVRNAERLEVTQSRFLDPFRRGLIPLIREQGTNRVCDETLPRFADLSADASAALDLLQLERAGALLAQGWTAFACERAVISDQAIARLLFLSGLLQLYLGEDDHGFFADAIAIAPGLPFPWEYPKRFQDAFTQARSGSGREKVKLELGTDDLAGLVLRLDGTLLTGNPTSLPAGRHFVQLVSRDGRVAAGTTINLIASPGGEAIAWPPPQLRAPSVAAAQQSLEQIAVTDKADAATLAALQWMLKETRRPWILVVIPETGERPGRALWVGENEESHEYSLSQLDYRWAAASGGLAAAAVVSTAFYITTYFHAEGLELTPGELYNFRWQTGLAAGGAVLSFAGALIAASYTFKFPDAFYHRKPDTKPSLKSLKLAAGPGSVAVGLGGTW